MNKTLPFKQVYSGAILAFLILEILAVWTTYTILGRGGVEVYPLAINLVDNFWLLLGSKILALACIVVPYILMKRYKLQTKSAFITSCLILGLIISVAVFDVAHNLLVLR
jgi:hypothetical protein